MPLPEKRYDLGDKSPPKPQVSPEVEIWGDPPSIGAGTMPRSEKMGFPCYPKESSKRGLGDHQSIVEGKELHKPLPNGLKDVCVVGVSTDTLVVPNGHQWVRTQQERF